jgi:hypothetical protein
MVPLARFGVAIRREVASTEPITLSISQLTTDSSLWIECDSDHTAATNGLSPPS